MVTVAAAPKDTVLVPAVNVAFAAVTFQFPLTVKVEEFATRLPYVPTLTAPAEMLKYGLDPVDKTVGPVAPAAEFWTVMVPVMSSAFAAEV